MSKWRAFIRWPRFDLPRCGAVYALYDDTGNLLYVGKTNNLRHRIGVHDKARRFLFIKARSVDCGWTRTAVEVRLIRRLKPPQNIGYVDERNPQRGMKKPRRPKPRTWATNLNDCAF